MEEKVSYATRSKKGKAGVLPDASTGRTKLAKGKKKGSSSRKGKIKKTEKRKKQDQEGSDRGADSPTGLLGDCLAVFGTHDLYAVLGAERNSSEQLIKKAYYKMALKYHPDKHPKSDQADELKEKFQLIGRVYAVLSDAEKKAVYDETGAVADESPSVFADWLHMFGRVTTEDIDNYLRVYCGSEEEKNELIMLYDEHKGDWDLISEYLVSYSLDEEDRLKTIVADAIASGAVQDHGSEPAKKRKARRARLLKEKKEVEKAAIAGPNGDTDELRSLIQEKQKSRARKLNEDLDRLLQADEKGGAKKRRRRDV